jgi:glycosyltransferase involved in cell wall biosynthesis
MKYGLPTDKCIILHVGHINAERNLEALVQLQKDDNQVVIIGSSSTQDVSYKDERLKKSLMEQGLQIIDGYIKNIEELYQLSDVYVFPVLSERGCIGVPLSILEARACGLPVVATAFGGLKRIYSGTTKEITYSHPSDFGDRIAELKLRPRPETAASDARRIDLMFRDSLDKMFQG